MIVLDRLRLLLRGDILNRNEDGVEDGLLLVLRWLSELEY
jgi:hypothetical protein